MCSLARRTASTSVAKSVAFSRTVPDRADAVPDVGRVRQGTGEHRRHVPGVGKTDQPGEPRIQGGDQNGHIPPGQPGEQAPERGGEARGDRLAFERGGAWIEMDPALPSIPDRDDRSPEVRAAGTYPRVLVP